MDVGVASLRIVLISPKRPVGANNCSRYGHWEGDTMVGHKHQGRIVTHVERKSRYGLAR